MNEGAFIASLKEAELYLKNIEALKSSGVKKLNDFSDEFKKASQQRDYYNAYKVAKRNLDYNFLLNDDSFFQFSFERNESGLPSVRYAFFQNPQEYIDYGEYILEFVKEDLLVVGELFREEYEQYLTELQINSASIPIRYDLDVKNYKALIHSVSHIHIGHMNDVRIPCNKIISPKKFALFVIKHSNYSLWKDLIEGENSYTINLLATAKVACVNLEATYWNIPLEGQELFLT